MSNQIAHDLNAKWRSNDVKTNEQNDFSSFHLDERILAGLAKAGYKIPSPVQIEAIPLCLSGSDVFVQGNAGTGKTLVFSILALTKVLEAEDLQVLIVAPTREGAYQISNTINAIGCMVKDLKCECFIGGFSFADDMSKAENCHIAVGTPGRIFHLIREDKLLTATIDLFVIDDIDELLNKFTGAEFTKIFEYLPNETQTVVTSLTCTDEVVELASEYLKDSSLAYCCESELPQLSGMAHYYHIVPFKCLNSLIYRKKLAVLKEIFSKVNFSQCLIFCCSISNVELLCADVKNYGMSVLSMTKAMDQMERLKALEDLKRNKCKVFIATDVGSRGLDAEHLDLVINFDFPGDSRSYLHRCGRAGRYGAKCSSISFLRENQKEPFFELEKEIQFKSYPLPDPLPEDLNGDLNSSEVTSLPNPLPEDLNEDMNSSEVTSLPCKLSDSENTIVKNRISSLVELSRKAVSNLEKIRAEESYLSENGLDEDSASQPSKNIELVEAYNCEPEMKNHEEISLKAPHAPYKKIPWGCSKGSVLSFSDLKNTIGRNSASKIKAKQDLRNESTDEEEDLLPSTTVPKPILKIKPTSKRSKVVSHKAFREVQWEEEIPHQKFTKISNETRKKKSSHRSSGRMQSNKPASLLHGTQVMSDGWQTASESNPYHCCRNISAEGPVDRCINHCRTYFNDHGNSCRRCSFSNSMPHHPSFQCCSLPNSNWQHQFLAQRDMFYKQVKFVNDFSNFLSHIHASLP